MNDPEAAPLRVKRAGDDPAHPGRFRVCVTWSDGSESRYPWAYLRAICPCAECRGQISTRVEANLDPGPDAPATRVASLSNVGRYALGLAFEDGHQAILPWETLRALDPARPLDARLEYLRSDPRLS